MLATHSLLCILWKLSFLCSHASSVADRNWTLFQSGVPWLDIHITLHNKTCQEFFLSFIQAWESKLDETDVLSDEELTDIRCHTRRESIKSNVPAHITKKQWILFFKSFYLWNLIESDNTLQSLNKLLNFTLAPSKFFVMTYYNFLTPV